MSCWTSVNIYYRLKKRRLHKKPFKKISTDDFITAETTELFDLALEDPECPDLQLLGTEASCSIQTSPVNDNSLRSSRFSFNEDIIVTISGDLRNVERGDFIQRLNKQNKTLGEYGISIYFGMVKIF